MPWVPFLAILTLTLLPSVKGNCESCRQFLSGVPNGFQKVTYTENKELIQNPRRGFWVEMTTKTSNFKPLTIGDLDGRRTKYGLVVIQRIYTMDTFTTRLLTDDFLQKIRDDMQMIRNAKMTTVLRFCYIFESHSKAPYGDASKDWVLKHIKQLSPLIHAASDVIDAVQAGFIGAWGEWYYTTYFGSPESLDHKTYPHTHGYSPQQIEDRREVIKALIDAVPVDIKVQQRYPSWNRMLFGPDPPTLQDVRQHTYKGRTGHHNDCFLSSKTDGGTYSAGVDIDYPYLHEVTKYLVTGGETCQFASKDPERHSCSVSLHDMAYFHYTSLNIGFYTPVLKDWQTHGCFNDIFRNMGYRFVLKEDWQTHGCLNDIFRNMGYRFVLKEAILPSVGHVGSDFCMRVVIRNHGFAAPIRNWNIFFVLRKGTEHFAARLTGLDMTVWLPGSDIVIEKNIHIPREFHTGTYDALLVFGDAHLSSHSDYNILLANNNVAEHHNGLNNLRHKILMISGGGEQAPSTCSPLERWTAPAPSKYPRVVSNVVIH